MASNSYKTLLAPVFIGNSVATVATVGSGKQWIVRRYTVINTDSAARTFGLYNGGTTAQYQITPSAISVDAGGMVEIDCCDTFNDGETIAAGASVASKLTLRISGDEYTV